MAILMVQKRNILVLDKLMGKDGATGQIGPMLHMNVLGVAAKMSWRRGHIGKEWSSTSETVRRNCDNRGHVV